MALRIGELLERRGVLNALQRDQILAEQRRSGRPFGDLAERLFGVCPRDIEQAWAEQYAALTEPIDPREACVDPDALAMVTARQAWQFSLLPLRFSGDELVLCSTQTHLARAMRFAAWRVPLATRFVLASPARLGEALARHYPMNGMRTEDAGNEVGIASRSVSGDIEDCDLHELE